MMRALTRHFFRSLFDLGILSEGGAEAFTRVLLGTIAILVSLGLVLARMYMGKYATLSLTFRMDGGPALYRQALLADNGMLLALAMWIVALVTALISHSLFPDETDFRVLIPLPISRARIFGSKLLALGLFAGLFIGATLLALSPLMLMMAAGRWSGHEVLPQMAAYLVTGVAATTFVVLTIVAASGLAVICLPRALVHGGATLVRSAMLCGLVLLAPFVFQTPAWGRAIGARAPWLTLAPNIWFVGLMRTMLGEQTPFFGRMAAIGVSALATAAALSFVTYAVLYARFDRVMLRSFRRSSFVAQRLQGPWRFGSRPVGQFRAISDFTMAAFRRSAGHQGTVLALSSCGVALVINRLIRNGVFEAIGQAAPDRAVVWAVLWAPCALIFIATLAVRAALVLPLEPRANWIFRMTEIDEARADQLDAVAHAMRLIGIGLPVALAAPLQWALLGPRAVITLAVAAAYGGLLVECHLRNWHRIPFTCSYLPGKHTVANSALIGIVAFIVFAGVGAVLQRAGHAQPGRGLLTVVLCAVAIGIMRRQRMRAWRVVPLMFEDLMPTEIQPIGLPRE